MLSLRRVVAGLPGHKALRPDTFSGSPRAGCVRLRGVGRLDAARARLLTGALKAKAPQPGEGRHAETVTGTVRRVDDLSTFTHYCTVMRRFWLSLLMVIALASGGVANAMVMANCPMLAQDMAQPVMAEGHDCCPDAAPRAPDEQPAKKMGDCAMAQACRTGPAMTPAVEAAPLIVSLIVVREPFMSDKSLVSRTPDEFWRPPRTI